MAKSKNFVAGFTECPDKFLELGEHARKKGFKDIDCIMPYPVHGFEESYGFKGSWIGLAAFGALLAGWVGGFSMQCWMHSISYPINIGGKPHISWPAFIPVTFECGILLAALTTLVSLLVAAQLRPSPFIKTIRERCTDDLFSIIIPVDNDEEISSAQAFLKEENIEESEVYDSRILEANQCGLEGKCC
jgi:hypothetical protein